MANIPVIAEINTLLDANDVTIAKAALGVLGAVTTGGTLGTPTSGTLTNATDLPIVAGTSGTLTVARGGTGATTLTSGSVLVGAGTSTPTLVAPSTSGNVLTSNGATWTSAPSAGGAVGFSAITGQPTDNASLTTALNLKTNNSVGFMEDFTNSTRWAEGAVITNNTTTPQVTATGDPYFLSVAGTASPAPNVQTRGYGAGANNQLWYLGSSVPTSGGKMSLGFKFEHRKNPTTISNFNNTFNISFNANVMQTPSTGSIIPGDGSDAGVVHINFDRNGISSCGIYLQADFTCLSHTKVNGLYSFTKQTQGNLPLDRDFVVLIKVDGNYMTITIPTVGSFLFFSTKLPSKIGAAKTYFWFEDIRDNSYSSWGFIKKIWGGNNSILDTDPDWGGFIGGNLTSLNTGTFHVLPGTVISNAANPSILTGSGLVMAATLPAIDYGFKAAATSATDGLVSAGIVANRTYTVRTAQTASTSPTAAQWLKLGYLPRVPLSISTSAARSGDVVTLTTATAHGLSGTPTIFISGITGFSGTDPNGLFTATSASGSTIVYTVTGAAGTYVYAGATVATRTIPIVNDTFTALPLSVVSAASFSGTTVTLTFASPHGLTGTPLIFVSGITGSSGTDPNNQQTVTGVPTTTTLTYTLTAPAGTYAVSSATTIGVASNSGVTISSPTTTTTNALANGGNVFIEGAYLSNVGTTAAGGSILGRSPMNIASGITTALSSTTATGALLKSFTRIPTFANSDSQSIEIYGQLVGVLAKRINIILDSAVGTLFDSDAAGTPLNSISGAYRIVIKRFSLSGAGSIFYTVMTLPDGTNLPMSRLSTNMITETINIRFQTTTAAAGGVTIEGAIQTVEKVINR